MGDQASQTKAMALLDTHLGITGTVQSREVPDSSLVQSHFALGSLDGCARWLEASVVEQASQAKAMASPDSHMGIIGTV